MTVRVAVHASGELGRRTRLALLAEPGTEVGSLSGEAAADQDGSIPSVTGWHVLVIDAIGDATQPHIEEARVAGIPIVVGDRLPHGYPVGDGTFVVGASSGSGLAAALAAAIIDPTARLVDARLAWTVPGNPLGAGTPITFPEPVGTLWAGWGNSPIGWKGLDSLVAPHEGPWMGVSVRVTHEAAGPPTSTLGIADDAFFLGGVSMAAAAQVAARGSYPPGVHHPGDPDGVFMKLARAGGLEIAEFVPA